MLCTLFLLFIFCIPLSAQDIAVVAAPTDESALKPWIEYRTNQGYTVHIIHSTQTSAPQIKESIAQVHRQTPLTALFIAGDVVAVPAPTLPSRIIAQFGKEKESASDDWYADMNNDGLADFPVGRFPGNIKSFVHNTLHYEQHPNISNVFQFVAGTGNFTPLLDSVIETAVRYILTESFPPPYQLSLLQLDWQSNYCPFPTDTPAHIHGTLNRRPLFWIYAGHGAPGMIAPLNTPLGYVPLPLTKAAENEPDTIVFLLCCYGGCYDLNSAYKTQSLAEQLLHHNKAVAVVAPSRTAMPYGMSVFGIELLNTFVRHINEQEPLTLGQLVWEAKRQAAGAAVQKAKHNRPLREMIESTAKLFDPKPLELKVQLAEHITMFHLFGDPLLTLPIPKRINVQVKRSQNQLTFTGQTPPKCRQVNIIVLPALSQITLRSPNRKEFYNDIPTQKQYNEEYCRNADNVLYAARVEVNDSQFEHTMTLPKDRPRQYRMIVTSDEPFALGGCSEAKPLTNFSTID